MNKNSDELKSKFGSVDVFQLFFLVAIIFEQYYITLNNLFSNLLCKLSKEFDSEIINLDF